MLGNDAAMMNDLFADQPYQQTNLLPYDGIVDDHGCILDSADADHYLNTLLQTIPWQQDEVMIMGKRITTQRQVAWYGDSHFDYTYSGITHSARPWTDEITALKQRIEAVTQTAFNSCLLNLYMDGTQGMTWHSDDETALGKNTVIASLSLGAKRKFALRHRQTRDKVVLWLPHGQLIVMRGETQHYWQHAVMKSANIAEPRINLTFRSMRTDYLKIR